MSTNGDVRSGRQGSLELGGKGGLETQRVSSPRCFFFAIRYYYYTNEYLKIDCGVTNGGNREGIETTGGAAGAQDRHLEPPLVCFSFFYNNHFANLCLIDSLCILPPSVPRATAIEGIWGSETRCVRFKL